MLPAGLHETAVVYHRHRFANSLTGLMWIRFRRWTALLPETREKMADKLLQLIPKMHKGMCNTCGWSGQCYNVQRLAENESLVHVMKHLPAVIQDLSFEEMRRQFIISPEPYTWAPTVPHREADDERDRG